MLKKIAIVFAVLLVAIGFGAHYLWSNLDSIVQSTIEKYGTAATQGEVKVSSVKISLTTGEGFLGGLSVGNPRGGYSSAKAISMGSISVKIDPRSVMGNGPIIISEVIIEKPQINYEMLNADNSNLQALERNAMSYANGLSGNTPVKETPDAKPARKVIINDLYVRQGQVGITAALLQNKTFSAPLPTIHLTNIGKDKGGATPAEVTRQVLQAISNSATQVANINVNQALGALKNGVGNTLKNGVSGATVPASLKDLLGR